MWLSNTVARWLQGRMRFRGEIVVVYPPMRNRNMFCLGWMADIMAARPESSLARPAGGEEPIAHSASRLSRRVVRHCSPACCELLRAQRRMIRTHASMGHLVWRRAPPVVGRTAILNCHAFPFIIFSSTPESATFSRAPLDRSHHPQVHDIYISRQTQR